MRQRHRRATWPIKAFGYVITDYDLTEWDWRQGRDVAVANEARAARDERRPVREVSDEDVLWAARASAVGRASRSRLRGRDRAFWEDAGWPCDFRTRETHTENDAKDLARTPARRDTTSAENPLDGD